TLERLLALVDRAFHPSDQLIDGLAQLALVLRIGHLADAAPHRRQQPIATAQVSGPHLVERAQVGGHPGGIDRRGRDPVQVFGRGGSCGRAPGTGHARESAPRATSTRRANDAASSTARSARIFRLSATPASLSPCMNWLYGMPFWRAAALMRA